MRNYMYERYDEYIERDALWEDSVLLSGLGVVGRVFFYSKVNCNAGKDRSCDRS